MPRLRSPYLDVEDIVRQLEKSRDRLPDVDRGSINALIEDLVKGHGAAKKRGGDRRSEEARKNQSVGANGSIAPPRSPASENLDKPASYPRAMAITLDLSTDHSVYDNFEEIVYQSFRRLGEPAADEDLLAKAKRGPLTTKELLPSGGAYTASDVAWSFWENENLAGFRPKPGDQIIDPEQEAYTVLEATRKKWRNTHRLLTRNLAIAFNLRDIVTIEQAHILEQPTIAARTRIWKPLFTNLRCRVQPQDETVKDERSMMGGTVRYTVLLSRQLRWDNLGEVRIKWETGRETLYLDPEKYHTAEQIGELPRIEASRKV